MRKPVLFLLIVSIISDVISVDLNVQLQPFHLAVDRTYNVLICCRCKFAISPVIRQVIVHLTSLHQDHSLSAKLARNYLGSAGLVAPSEARLKPNHSALDERLLIHDGLQCQTCSHISIGDQAHRRHARAHGDCHATVAQFQTWAYLPKSRGRWLLRTTLETARHCDPITRENQSEEDGSVCGRADSDSNADVADVNRAQVTEAAIAQPIPASGRAPGDWIEETSSTVTVYNAESCFSNASAWRQPSANYEMDSCRATAQSVTECADISSDRDHACSDNACAQSGDEHAPLHEDTFGEVRSDNDCPFSHNDYFQSDIDEYRSDSGCAQSQSDNDDACSHNAYVDIEDNPSDSAYAQSQSQSDTERGLFGEVRSDNEYAQSDSEHAQSIDGHLSSDHELAQSNRGLARSSIAYAQSDNISNHSVIDCDTRLQSHAHANQMQPECARSEAEDIRNDLESSGDKRILSAVQTVEKESIWPGQYRGQPAPGTMIESSDIFYYHTAYRLLICRHCRRAVRRGELKAHLINHHPKNIGYLQVRNIVQDVETRYPRALTAEDMKMLPKEIPEPVPILAIYEDGLQCMLEPEICKYLCRSQHSMKQHWRKSHILISPKAGRPSLRNIEKMSAIWSKHTELVRCQQFFIKGAGSNYIKVLLPRTITSTERQQAFLSLNQNRLAARVFNSLEAMEREEIRNSCRLDVAQTEKEISPWLMKTGWLTHLKDQDLLEICKLAAPPNEDDEPALAKICQRLDKLVGQAHKAISDGDINPFDQTRINSYMIKARPNDRPIMINMQKATWRKYLSVWHCLAAYVYRIQAYLGHNQSFEASLTLRQSQALQAAIRAVNEVGEPELSGEHHAGSIDHKCLELFISLLDQELKESLFQSIVISFLAVNGIQPVSGGFKDAIHYTTCLSAFLKIAQMLVVRKALMDVEEGKARYAADQLDEMRMRFLILDSRSPTSWILSLRMFGKAIRNTTTSVGQISWSDNSNRLSYREIRNLPMSVFCDVVKEQLKGAQKLFDHLLLLEPDEDRLQLDIHFDIRDLVDNVAENRPSYNFTMHPSNRNKSLPNRKLWLMTRLLNKEAEQRSFFKAVQTGTGPAILNIKAAEAYEKKVDTFLETMLFLIHLTSGQPARGPELLSLRHTNNRNGEHRNVFIENGVVSTVTRYHKGYNITNSFKIIHRFLPREVGEMLIYYIWLVIPFRNQLNQLGLNPKVRPSPYIWAHKSNPRRFWDTSRLSKVLTDVFQPFIGTKMGVGDYRHIAIAIAREHLPNCGFKRDFELEDSYTDLQAGHNSATAGSLYARQMQDGQGHVDIMKRKYKQASRDWHAFLGLLASSQREPENRRLGLGVMMQLHSQEGFPETEVDEASESETESHRARSKTRCPRKTARRISSDGDSSSEASGESDRGISGSRRRQKRPRLCQRGRT